jgi:hypothetical protein
VKGEVKLGDDYARVEKTVVPAFEGNGSKLLYSETFLFQYVSLHWASRYQMDGCNYKSDLKAASIVGMQSLRPHSDAWSCEPVLQQSQATQITKYKYEEYRECILVPLF